MHNESDLARWDKPSTVASPIVSVLLNNVMDVALVDTGAIYSVFRAEYAAMIPQGEYPVERMTAANGTKIRVIGKGLVHLVIGDYRFTHEVYIADVTQNLLGMDILHTHGVRILSDLNAIEIKGSRYIFYPHASNSRREGGMICDAQIQTSLADLSAAEAKIDRQ